jgi:hypothetical protein
LNDHQPVQFFDDKTAAAGRKVETGGLTPGRDKLPLACPALPL